MGADYWRLFGSSALSNLADGVRFAALPLLVASITSNPVAVAGVAAAQAALQAGNADSAIRTLEGFYARNPSAMAGRLEAAAICSALAFGWMSNSIVRSNTPGAVTVGRRSPAW